MIHSFLLIGQSNMAGRGFIGEVQQIYDEQIKMLRNGGWQTMWEPINPDRPSSGIGLAASFAAAWRRKNLEETVGLIPCAEGGASLQDWAVDGILFKNAVFQATLAQRESKITGILWHQGENDCFPALAANYAERFSVIMDALRQVLQIPDVPLIIGGLGDYLPNGRYGKYFEAYSQVNLALQEFATNIPNCYYVTASGLTANPDGLHFDAISQRRFGIRYFEAFHKQKHITGPLSNEIDVLDAIYSRSLTKTEKLNLLEYQFAFGQLTLTEVETLQSKINGEEREM